MNTEHDPTETLDVRGESCPMPVVRTKQTVDGLAAGELLEVLATDAGSVSDVAGWAAVTDGVALDGQTEQPMDGETVYVHYVRVEG